MTLIAQGLMPITSLSSAFLNQDKPAEHPIQPIYAKNLSLPPHQQTQTDTKLKNTSTP